MKRLAIRGAVVLTLAVGLTAVAALAGMWPLGGEQRAEASPGVDLVITMDPSPSEATVIEVNDTIDYYITVSNIGDTDAHNVLIRDWVGEGLNLIGLGGDPSVTCEHPPRGTGLRLHGGHRGRGQREHGRLGGGDDVAVGHLGV